MWDIEMIKTITLGIVETLYMTLFSTLLAYMIGLPLGIALVVTEKDNLLSKKWVNRLLNIIVNITRSVPFQIGRAHV